MIDTTHKGSPLPKLALTSADGRKLQLDAATGKPMLVNLWATWCAPCVAELPQLDALATRHAATLSVVAVSQDLIPGDQVGAFLKAKGAPHLAAWLDPEGTAASQYGATTLPTTIAYDAQGRELWRTSGGHDWGSAESAKLIAAGAP